jgi:hypothetical protein
MRPSFRRSVLAALAGLLLVGTHSSAYAGGTGEELGHEWYGYQTLLADGLGFVQGARAYESAAQKQATVAGVDVGAGFAATQFPLAALAAGGTYVLGAPVVHVAYGRPRRALEDAAARVVLPVAAGVVGFVAGAAAAAIRARANDDSSPLAASVPAGVYGGMAGAAVGGAFAIGVDAARAKKTAEAPSRAPGVVAFMRPDLVLDRRTAGFGLRGTF